MGGQAPAIRVSRALWSSLASWACALALPWGTVDSMPPQQTPSAPAPSGKRRVCKALTTSGSRCKATAVPGLTVCTRHGGATATSARKGKRASVESQAAVLWGVTSGTGGLSIEEELTKLARNKITDVLALRLELSREGSKHIGMLRESEETTEAEVGEDVYTTVKTKRASGASPWVAELHKAEQELIQILRLLQEVTGGSEEVDTKRIRIQTAREAARLLKAFPGISVDEVAAEVSKRAS